MSEYRTAKTSFKDVKLLLEALAEMGYSQVEYHETPQTLIDWHGHKRPQKANVIVRRKHIDSCANDIGYVLNPETKEFESIISEYDSHRHNTNWRNGLARAYAERKVIREAKRLGLQFMGSKVVNGNKQLQFMDPR